MACCRHQGAREAAWLREECRAESVVSQRVKN